MVRRYYQIMEKVRKNLINNTEEITLTQNVMFLPEREVLMEKSRNAQKKYLSAMDEGAVKKQP